MRRFLAIAAIAAATWVSAADAPKPVLIGLDLEISRGALGPEDVRFARFGATGLLEPAER